MWNITLNLQYIVIITNNKAMIYVKTPIHIEFLGLVNLTRIAFGFKAFGETESRRKRFQKMTEDLEQFYTTLQDIDQWLDQAIEKSRDLQTSKDNIHNQFNDYKVLILAVLYYTPQFSMGTH